MSNLAGTKGGSGVWQRIISEMPEHDVYLEPFWGRGTIYRRKRTARITVGCDVDPVAIEHGRRHGARMYRADGMQFVADYFRGSAAATFGGFSWESHFVYFDPPYLGCGPQYYTWFRRFIERQSIDETEWHRELCRLFVRLPCPAALSGYQSDVYADELRGVRSIRIPTVNRAGRRVTEWLWLNFDPPSRYHDTRFVGIGRRERERIRRRVRNWGDGLRKMPAVERQAVWDQLAAEYAGAAGDDVDLSGRRSRPAAGDAGSGDAAGSGRARSPDG